MARDYTFQVRMTMEEKEIFFRLVSLHHFTNPAEYARRKLLMDDDFENMKEFSSIMRNLSDGLTSTRAEIIQGLSEELARTRADLDAMRKTLRAEFSEQLEAAGGSMRGSVKELFERAAEVIRPHECKFKQPPERKGHETEAFLFGAFLGMLAALAAFLLYRNFFTA